MAWTKEKGSKEPKKEPKTYNFNEIFRPSTQLEKIHGIKVGVFGRAKVGKSHFALTAPLPIYAVDTEGSLALNVLQFDEKRRSQIFIANVLREADKLHHKIDLSQSLAALEEAIDMLVDTIVEQGEADKVGTIVIDSGTDVWDWLGIWIDAVASQKSSVGPFRLEWGKANRKYTQLIQMLIKSNWNVIWTFRAVEAINEQGQSLKYDQPKWQKNTPYWLDVICEMKMTGPQTNLIKFAGDRYGRISKDLENPTWDTFVAHLKKHTKVEIA